VPDYFDIVTNPMCWSIIDSKLDRHEYWDVKAFKVRLLSCIRSILEIDVMLRMTSTLSSTMLFCIINLEPHFTRLPAGSGMLPRAYWRS
jgi:hypothetical protein